MPSRINIVRALLLASLALVAAAPARADAPPRIATLAPPGSPALNRLRAELAASGFQLRLVGAPSWPPARAEILESARSERAIAGLALIPGDDSVEIWIVDRVTGKTVVRELALGAFQQRDEADLIAICAVETLQATLLEISLPHTSRGELEPPAAARALVRSDRSRFAVRIAGAIGYGPGALGAAGEVGLALTAGLGSRVRIGLDGFLPLTDANVAGPEGRAEVGLTLGGAFIEASLLEPSAAFDVLVGAGAWVGVLRTRGGAAPPYVGKSAHVATLAPHLDIGAVVPIGWHLAIGARASGAVATREAVVRFAGRQVASWGRPYALGALFLELRLGSTP